VLAEQPYCSVQGEGMWTGMPMTFVRLQGCNVGCVWCDSYYTWMPHNVERIPDEIKNNSSPIIVSFEELYSVLDKISCSHVWFTGGEPSLQSEAIVNFMKITTPWDFQYHICTAGRIYNSKLFDLLHFITVDVKAPSSNTSSKKDVVDKIYKEHSIKTEFKMVVDNTESDKEFAKRMVDKYNRVEWTLQPKYISEVTLLSGKHKQLSMFVDKMYWELEQFAQWVVDNFKQYPNVRMGTQFHKHVWRDRQRGI